jgi:tRNA(adenine34) deaminase
LFLRDHEDGMRAALAEARKALDEGEVPIGAVVVHEGRIVGRGHNQTERLQDATAHAEILAIGAASNTLGTWRLSDCTIYVTLEPCVMCAGALVLARMGTAVYGALDPKAGAFGSRIDIPGEPWLNHRLPSTSGVLAGEAGGMLTAFFEMRRAAAGGEAEGER